MGEPLVTRDRLLSCGCPGEAAKIWYCRASARRAGTPRAQDAMVTEPVCEEAWGLVLGASNTARMHPLYR